jgi:hypothetical protein
MQRGEELLLEGPNLVLLRSFAINPSILSCLFFSPPLDHVHTFNLVGFAFLLLSAQAAHRLKTAKVDAGISDDLHEHNSYTQSSSAVA